jgi:hypothetical protein
MAEDKIRVSGKSPGKWQYKPKGKAFRDATSINEFRGHDFVGIWIKPKKGAATTKLILGKGYKITFRVN